MLTRTKNLSLSDIKNARNVASGLYRFNAKTSIGYAFNKKSNGKSVAVGEFVLQGESIANFDGFICFKNSTLIDVNSGEIITI